MIRRVFQDGLVYGLASVFSRGISMFTLPIYARVLAPADFGALDMILAFGALISLSVALEIHQALIRMCCDLDSFEEKSRLAGTAWWFSFGMYSIFIIVCLLASQIINYALLGNNNYLTAFHLGVLLIASNGLFYFLQCQLRTELRSREYALISILYSMLTMIFSSTLAFIFSLGIEGLLLGQLIASLITVIVGFFRVRNSLGFTFDAIYLVKMIRFSVPLVPSGIATFFSTYSNRIVLNSQTSLDDVGMFGMGLKIAGIAGLMMVGVQNALTPLIYNNYQKPETQVQLAKLFEWFVAASLLVCLSLGLFASDLLQLFTTPQYLLAAPIVILLAPAVLLNQLYVFAPGIEISKKMHWQLWISLTICLVSIFLNWIFISLFGFFGAAWATILSSALFATLYIGISQRFYYIPFRWRQILFSVLFGILIGLFNFILNFDVLVKIIMLLMMTLCFFFFGLVTKKEIMKIFELYNLKIR